MSSLHTWSSINSIKYDTKQDNFHPFFFVSFLFSSAVTFSISETASKKRNKLTSAARDSTTERK